MLCHHLLLPRRQGACAAAAGAKGLAGVGKPPAARRQDASDLARNDKAVRPDAPAPLRQLSRGGGRIGRRGQAVPPHPRRQVQQPAAQLRRRAHGVQLPGRGVCALRPPVARHAQGVRREPLLRARALDDLRAFREWEAALMVRCLADAAAAGMAVALAKTANVCTTNSLSRATVGLRVFDTAGSKLGAEEFNEIVLKLIEVGGVLNVGDFVPVLRWLDPQGVVAKMKKLHRRFDDMMNRIIAERRAGAFATTAGEEGGKDLLGLLLAMVQEDKSLTGAEENKITDTDVKALILNLLVAGTDTTSITVEWAMAELIRHPDIMKQAQEELDAVMGRERLVSESDLPRLTSLSAIIKETFRLHPSTPLSLPRMATEDCKVAGYCIPKGTELFFFFFEGGDGASSEGVGDRP
uniref:Cytochrome P450 n=1 Tax=Triticum aestivum TaxID=4565 RepID=A0A3B6NJP3_WHEAT